MFIDKVRVNLRAGKGGEGAIYFGRDRKPNGGDGGDGGDVLLEGSTDIYDLSSFNKVDELKAEDGMRGGPERKQGKTGADLVLKVPLTTIVEDLKGKRILEINKPGERKLLLKAGRGGLGNFNFRRGQVLTLRKTTPGEAGEDLMGFFSLYLKTDIVFVGLPNAGKSSLLNSLANTTAKVADYPFTTLEPNLGVTKEGLVLLDLPGMIEGTSKGKGLGLKYTKHISSARLLAHFLTLESADIEKDYQIMREELALIDPKLNSMPEIILLTKSDEVTLEVIKKAKKIMSKYSKNIFVISVLEEESLDELKAYFNKTLAQ